MAMTMHVDIVSAEQEIFSGLAEMLVAPATLGEVGVMPGHAPLLTTLGPGEVRIKVPESDELSFYVSGGLLEIQPHLVTVLSDTAERSDHLDEAAAKESMAKAERVLAEHAAGMDEAAARAEIAAAAAQLRAIQRLRRQAGR